MMTITEGSNVITMKFYYDDNGTPIMLDYNDTLFYYVTNLQGDVVGIVCEAKEVGSYVYDAWGNPISTSSNGTAEANIIQNNPLRYRGYIYDTETGFYYLQSRYYDPAICRFINADETEYLGASGDLISFNLYAYCSNDPVMGYDPSGQFWISAIIKAAVVVVAVVAKVVCTVKETKRVQKELDSLPEPTADITETFRETLKTNANTVKETTKIN